MNKCYCDIGWSGADCSMHVEVTLPPQHTTAISASTTRSSKMEKKETPYGMLICVHSEVNLHVV